MTAESDAIAAFAAEGLSWYQWSNGPGFRYEEHQHPYHKVLFCTQGSIVFHTPEGDIELEPGERLDLPAGTPHAASVGVNGVTCMEGAHQKARQD